MRRASYRHRASAAPPRPRDILRLLTQGGFAAPTAGARQIPVERAGLPALGSAAASWTWLGHASFLVRLGGLAVLIDPVLSTRIPGTPPRLTPVGLDWHELPHIDAVLISHNHYDHLDEPTVRRLPRHTPILTGAGLGRWFSRRGFRAVAEFDWWDSTRIGGVEFAFTPSHHWSRRGLFDTCATLWGGWVLTAPDGTRTYHAGDSGYGPRFAEIGRRYPGIDVAMMPIGAYEPRWFMALIHVNPEEAVAAVEDLGARRMACMHWGTFVLTREPVEQPPQRVAKAWAAAGRDPSELWLLAIGQTRSLPEC